MAAHSYLIISLDKTIKDVLRRPRGEKEDDNAVASKPGGPFKENIDTGGNKYYSVSEVLADLFFLNLNSQIAYKASVE